MKIRVYYEDTDAGGIVYHTRYINFCERARSELFFQRDMQPHQGNGSGFVVKDIHASFFSPARLGDLLEVRSELIKTKHTSLVLRQEIFREEEKLFGMEIVLVYLSMEKPSRIPEQFLSFFGSD